MSLTVSPNVAPSGQGILFLGLDGSGNPSNVTNIVDNNERQSLTIAGNPSGGGFTLAFSGQTTATIPAIPSPPYRYFQWNYTLASPGTYDLSANLFVGGSGTPNQFYEVFDGTTLLGTATLNNAFSTSSPSGAFGGPPNPTPLIDGTLTTYSGGALRWYPLGSATATNPGRFTFSSTALHVRVSCNFEDPSGPNAGRNNLAIDNLRIATTDGATVVRVDAAHPPGSIAAPGVQLGTSPTGWQVSDDTNVAIEMDGFGAGTRYLVDPAVVRSALEALSNIGTGNVTVTGDGFSLSPVLVTMTGAIGGVAQPLMTASDPTHVTVASVAKGGLLPSIKVNGGTAIPLPYAWMHYYAGSAAMPGVMFLFPQWPAATTYSSIKHGPNTVTGNWEEAFLYSVPAGYTANSMRVASSGTASYYYRPVPDGQYRVSATWPGLAGLSADVVYTVRDVAGNVLGTYHTNQTANPTGAIDQGYHWDVLGTFTLTGLNNGLVVTQSNGTSDPMVGDAVRFERISADNSLRIEPDDVVTYSAGIAWASCVAGNAPAATDQPVTNLVGQSLCPALPSSVSMEIGYNLPAMGANTSTFIFNDLLCGLYGVQDWPTIIGGTSEVFALSLTGQTFGGDNRAYPNTPTGHHILTWDGTENLRISPQGGSTGEYAATTYPAPGNVGHQRFYDFQGDPFFYGPQCFLIIDSARPTGTGSQHAVDISNATLLPAGMTPGTAPKFRQNVLDRMAGMTSTRMMDTSGAITSNPTEFSDFDLPATWVSKGTAVRTVVVSPHTISAYTGTDFAFDVNRGQMFQFTFSAPHGLADNQLVLIQSTSSVVADLANDLGHTGTFSFVGIDGYITKIDDYSVLFYHGIFAENVGGTLHPYAMVGTITDPPTTMTMSAGNGCPLKDQVDWCNTTGTSMHWNMAFSASDDCCTQFGTYMAAHLNAGLKLRLACSNEVWNFFSKPFACAVARSYAFYGGSSQDPWAFTCEMSHRQWLLIEAAWVAGGRDIDDIIRVMESLYFDSSQTRTIALYCHDHGITFHELAVAPYLGNRPSFASGYQVQYQFGPTIDRLTVDQQLDFMEYHFTYGGYEFEMPGHYDALTGPDGSGGHARPEFLDVKVITYEGGPESMGVDGGSELSKPEMFHKIVRHPRWYGAFQTVLTKLQDSTGAGRGCTLFQDYLMSASDFGAPTYAAWSAYAHTAQLPYEPGDSTQDAIQVNQFNDITLVRSVTGGALLNFASLLDATPTPDFTLAVTGSGSLDQPGTLNRTVTLTALDGYAGTAALTTSGLPTGVTPGYSPSSLTGGGTVVSTLTLTATTVTAGTSTVTVTGTDSANSLTHNATFSLTVNPADMTPTIVEGRRNFGLNRHPRHR